MFSVYMPVATVSLSEHACVSCVNGGLLVFQMSTLAYTGRAPLWLDKSYWSVCLRRATLSLTAIDYSTPDTIPFANWLALLRKGCTM